MHPADIKAHLAKAGTSQSAIARSLTGRTTGEHLTPGAVWLVIHGLARSERIAAAISKAIQLPVRDIFPGRYLSLEKMQAIEARGGFAAVLKGSAGQANAKRNPAVTKPALQTGGVPPAVAPKSTRRAAVKRS